MSDAAPTQRIEAPDDADIDRIARQILHAQALVEDITGSPLTGGMSDLSLIQRVLDGGQVAPESTCTLQALGIAFGKVFVQNTAHYDWWMVEDEFGRDPALRFKQTSLLAFPQTMLSKRIEDGESVDVRELFDDLVQRLAAIRAEIHPDD